MLHFHHSRRALPALLLLCATSTFLSAADYFWVGGPGNWSDITHWATSSGGNTTHAQAPTSEDDVYFDANSFTGAMDIVRLNTDVNFCRSMSWASATGNPVFLGGRGVTLNVFGSLELTDAMDYRFDGTLIFTGAADNTVDFRGKTAAYVLEFSGTGAWTLAGDVAVDSILLLNEGELSTGGRAITTGYFRSDGNSPRTLNLGASALTITGNTWRPFPRSYPTLHSQPLWLDARNLTLLPGTSVVELTGNQTDIFLEGPGTLDLNELVLSAPAGSATIRHWTDQNGISSGPTVRIARLNLLHRTLLEGALTVGELELHGGQQYRFESGTTFTLGNLIANGDCQGTLDISATEADVPAVFSAPGPITTDFTSLRGITASGGGTFTAGNAIDLGGNTGWTLNERPTETFFWIGNTGNWNDPDNWSFASGGAPNGCVPSLADDVFFDGNSFSAAGQTVRVNVENAACRNMSWSGATSDPELAGPARNRMQIGGSLEFTPGMRHTFAGTYVFSSNQTGNTITSAGHALNFNAIFEGGGEWTLLDALEVYYELDILSGIFRTNDQSINTNFFYSRGTGVREIYLGNSLIEVESRRDSFFFSELAIHTDNLLFDAGNSVVNLQGGFGANVSASGPDPLELNVVNFFTVGGFANTIFDAAENPTVAVDSLSFFNNGFISGNNIMTYLFFAPGQTYELRPGTTQIVLELVASGSCEAGMTNIISAEAGETATLTVRPDLSFERLYLRDIDNAGGTTVTADLSIDGGGNTFWQINEVSGRTLFWVGGTGTWHDTDRWSLTSGGPGGECIPTLVDDVVIDENSSTGGPFFINNATDRYTNCKDINWTSDLTDECAFNVGRMRIAGSFTNEGTMSFGASPVLFIGEEDHTVTMGGARFFDFFFEQSGTYTLLDDFRGNNLAHVRGTLNFTNQTGDLERMTIIRSSSPKFMNLADAHLRLSYNYDGFTGGFSAYAGANITLDPGNSLIELTGASGAVRTDNSLDFNRLLFSNPAGNGLIIQQNLGANEPDEVTASSLQFNGNGRLDLEMTTDTLLFAPGKSYTLQANGEQTINSYWQTIGNNCTPIALQSSINGVQARTRVPGGGKILADFVQMRNITGVGGAEFLAGARSTDIGNSNENWIFETAPQFQTVGFLGQDRAICAGEDIVLDAFNFSPGERYLWQDGSTDTTFVTDQSGTYSVEVTFENNCLIRDTIVVLDALDFSIDLPDAPIICEGDTLTLTADAGLNSATYLWQDGSTEPTLSAFTTGEYKVTVNLDGCLRSDSTQLTVNPTPVVDLGDDRVVACAGEEFTLTATVNAEIFTWQDGSTAATFSGDQPGVYFVEASNGQCTVRDSVEVVYVTPNPVSLGSDTTLCTADEFILDAGNPGHGYRWQDGSTDGTLTATATGRFFVVVDSAGCTASDTINLIFPDLPDPDVADGYEICAGETFRLTTATPADAVRWSNGQSGPEFTTQTGGSFTAEFEFGPCTLTKDFAVEFLAPPVIDLGEDITECEGTPVVLDAGMVGTWQDGSTAPTFTTTADGQFRVVVTDGPCVVADSVNVSFLPAPEISLGEDQTACAGEELSVTVVPANAVTIIWDDGSPDASRTFTEAGIRFAEVEDGNGCVSRDSVELTFTSPPLLDLGPDTTVCDDTPFSLTAVAGPGTLTWPDGSNEASYLVPAPGTIRVFLEDDFCRVADTVSVAFTNCVTFNDYLPTAFSPNFDGINDEFGLMYNNRVEILTYSMEVFDRWGSPVFRSEDVDSRWDGTKAGEAVDVGVYVYVIEVAYRDDRETGSRVISGDVMVVR